MNTPSLLRRTTAALAGLAMTTVALAVATPPAVAFDDTHTLMQGSATAMGQTNGPVWDVEVAGDRIYAGGGFTSTRPHGAARGSQETGQAYLAAFDAQTGAPIASFTPELVNTWSSAPPIVRALELSPDGETLYVGGDFNQIDGERTEHVAKFDTATGDFLGVVGWNGTDGFVDALAASNDGETLYVGGAFTRANWSTRNDLAAFDLTDNSLRSWAPRISNRIDGESLRVVDLAVSSDDSQVFAAGPFRAMNGQATQGFAAVSAQTGANVSFYDSEYLYSPTSWGTSLAVQDDTVYVGGRDDRASTSRRTEGVFAIDTSNGNERWYAKCYGDTFGVLPIGDDVYVASHAHDCADAGGMPEQSPRVNLAIHALDKDTGTVRPYFVQTGGTSANPDSRLLSRALATDGEQLVMGGGYDTLNGSAQTNISRFGVGSSAPERAAWPSGSTCDGCARVNLRVLEASDRDDVDLTYEVYRDWHTTNPIAVVDSETVPYELDTFDVVDTGVTRGQRVYYRVLVKDPAGNQVWSVRTPTFVVGDTAATRAQAASSSGTATTSSLVWTGGPSGAATATRGGRGAPKPTVEPRTAAQRAAEDAAERLGLRHNGRVVPPKVKEKVLKPVLDDQSVPTTIRELRRWLPDRKDVRGLVKGLGGKR
ncbi:PQQ-like beta-propeller repeat protein [Nocardioides panacisoli]|uniref:PQQ-like beta-propeller repeat protein n=1 Tax=Nocardioides panacisoli TaxID=627624 RepID=UPI001C63A532|nr:PQQ-like beta-propeller repeat protein [Nocardioides panacisoli]QYJ02973.1 PQQ-like beta-propeller repeat protein [Nocardioides panacisoli]